MVDLANSPPRNPRGDICPDYLKPRYADTVESLMVERRDTAGAVIRPACTRDEAITVLKALWHDKHN
jgi:hypothetical protein